MRTLDLVVTHHWFDMIVSRKKTEEYREIKTYWRNRFGCQASGICTPRQACKAARVRGICDNRYSCVRFRRGYTSTTVKFEIERISVGIGKPEWGAPINHEVYIIKLGQKIEQ